MNIIKRISLWTLAGALLAVSIPGTPAAANGAASTRNIIIGGAAAALLIINHNRKVHERYAEDARRQAQVEQDAHNQWVAYQDEKSAYQHEVAVNESLKHEVALQHQLIVGQRSQISSIRHQLAMRNSGAPKTVAQVDQPTDTSAPFMEQTSLTRSARTNTTRRTGRARPQQLAVQSFGWGTF